MRLILTYMSYYIKVQNVNQQQNSYNMYPIAVYNAENAEEFFKSFSGWLHKDG